MPKWFYNLSESSQQFVLLFAWVCGPLFLFALGVRYFSFSEGHFLAIILIGLGCYLFFHHPLKALGYSPTVEVGTLFVITSILLIYGTAVFVVPTFDQENKTEPCGELSPQFKCYRLPQTICRALWNSYESECTSEVKINMGSKATALIGTSVKRCTGHRFDKYFYYTRKDIDNPYCVDYFKSVKE